MGWLADFLGGKKYLVWLIGGILAALGKLPGETFHQLTMIYMVSEGVQGIATKDPAKVLDPGLVSKSLWTVLGGRKFSAFMVTTVVMGLGHYEPMAWLQVAGAYAGTEMLEKVGLGIRKGIADRKNGVAA